MVSFSHVPRSVLIILLYFCLVISLAQAQNDVPTHPADGQFIKEWLVLGPFFPNDLENTTFLASVDGETNIDPKAGDMVTTADGKRLTWKPYTTKGNIVDFIGAIGTHENAVAYAFCILQSQVTGDVQFRLGRRRGANLEIWIKSHSMSKRPGASESTSLRPTSTRAAFTFTSTAA